VAADVNEPTPTPTPTTPPAILFLWRGGSEFHQVDSRLSRQSRDWFVLFFSHKNGLQRLLRAELNRFLIFAIGSN